MPATSKRRVTLIGLPQTLQAVRQWLTTKSRVPVKFQPLKRRGPGKVVIRIEGQ